MRVYSLFPDRCHTICSMGRILAAADIGSNTVHLLVAETNGSSLRRIANESDWLGLGEIVAAHGCLPSGAVEKLVRSLKSMRGIAASCKAQGLYVFATEAIRIARNHSEVLKLIKKRTGLEIALIPGRMEAELSLRGAMLDSGGASDFTLFEIGGGSAQVAHCVDGKILEEASLPLGTGRLRVNASLGNPPSADEIALLQRIVNESVNNLEVPISKSGVASGGVARGMIRALHPDGDPVVFLEEMDFLAWSTARMTYQTVAARFNVRLKRAEALLPGATVYAALCRRFGFDKIRVSEFGVREGAILYMANGRLKPCPI